MKHDDEEVNARLAKLKVNGGKFKREAAALVWRILVMVGRSFALAAVFITVFAPCMASAMIANASSPSDDFLTFAAVISFFLAVGAMTFIEHELGWMEGEKAS